MRQIVVKEGPLVLVRRIIASEIILSFLFYTISFITNYEEGYRGTILPDVIRYDIFLAVTFSLVQIVLITSLFLYWYFSYIEVSEDEVVVIKGIVKRKRKSYLLRRLQSVEVEENYLERKMRHASICLQFDEGKTLHLRNIARFEEVVEILQAALQSREKKKITLETLISLGENNHIEFKETLRFDIRQEAISKEVEKATLKTVARFLNAKGGTLIIGVNDSGVVQGLQRDFKTLKRQNRNGFQNHLTMLIKENLGAQILHNIFTHFEEKEKNELCLVEVAPSREPIYFKDTAGKEEFFVRSGNTTQPLTMSEAQSYIKERF